MCDPFLHPQLLREIALELISTHENAGTIVKFAYLSRAHSQAVVDVFASHSKKMIHRGRSMKIEFGDRKVLIDVNHKMAGDDSFLRFFATLAVPYIDEIQIVDIPDSQKGKRTPSGLPRAENNLKDYVQTLLQRSIKLKLVKMSMESLKNGAITNVHSEKVKVSKGGAYAHPYYRGEFFKSMGFYAEHFDVDGITLRLDEMSDADLNPTPFTSAVKELEMGSLIVKKEECSQRLETATMNLAKVFPNLERLHLRIKVTSINSCKSFPELEEIATNVLQNLPLPFMVLFSLPDTSSSFSNREFISVDFNRQIHFTPKNLVFKCIIRR